MERVLQYATRPCGDVLATPNWPEVLHVYHLIDLGAGEFIYIYIHILNISQCAGTMDMVTLLKHPATDLDFVRRIKSGVPVTNADLSVYGVHGMYHTIHISYFTLFVINQILQATIN